MHGVVGEHPGVLEDHRSNGRFLPPLGEFLVGLAWSAEGIQGGGPARIRLGFAGKRGKRPDCVAVVGAALLQRCGAHQLQGAGQGVSEWFGRELHPASRPFQQPAASFDLRLEVFLPLACGFELLGRDTLLLTVEVRRFDLPARDASRPGDGFRREGAARCRRRSPWKGCRARA